MDAQRPDDTRTDSGFGALWSSDGVTRSLAPTATGVPIDLPFLFAGGQRFGPYLIVRPIGKGGMGQVYEAEEIDSGRRVAVKILSRGIGDDEELGRFLQEGRLAASLSHPNTVYVFGTTEVQGFPVIAMELAPSGTLKDLVVPGAPMPPAQAVDALLQVIAGLEAAASIGILHRDVKPSNCFVAEDGRVLVGDFGLSIATLARVGKSGDAPGTILGTPGFASPEQLRGEALDVRSDIYSVGATIYYLLTGKAPFDDPDLTTMMTRVATEPPPALTIARPDIPSRLGSVVAKCLAKKPGDRYATYAALRSALEPFRSASVTPGPLGRRFLAGFVDSYAARVPVMPLNMYLGARGLELTSLNTVLWSLVPGLICAIVYYTILEGRFGWSVGKLIFNLRVVDRAETAPGYRRALVRTLVFLLPSHIFAITMTAILLPLSATGNTLDARTQALVAVFMFGVAMLIFAVQFSTVRRRNGYAALQDLASGTRVVLRPRSMEVRKSAAVRATRAAGGLPTEAAQPRRGEAFDGDRVGPYLVPRGSFDRARALAAPLLVAGFDDRLRRPVWVELLPEGTPPVPGWRRDLGRATRLRWLSGRRQGADCWDAYEAVDGVPFTEAIASPQPWSRVRHWIVELASEIAAASKDGSLPLLAADRIWIDVDDRARLLDWAPPSPAPPSPGPSDRATARPASPVLKVYGRDLETSEPFLYGVAMGALRGKDPAVAQDEPLDQPLPLPARTFLQALRDGAIATPGALVAAASDLLRGPASFPRGRRAAQIAACAIIPVAMPIAVLSTLSFMQKAQTSNPRAFAFDTCAKQLASYAKIGEAKLNPAQKENRRLVEIYIAEHLQDEVQESAAAARSFPILNRARGQHTLAERAVASHPVRSPEDVQRAGALVARLTDSTSKGLAQLVSFRARWGMGLFMIAWSCAIIGAIAIAGALVTGSGFTIRSIGAALVNGRGEPASRLRATLRAIVTWLPAAAALLLLMRGPRIQQMTTGAALLQTIPLALLAAGAAWAIARPSRAVQDRIAGTWIVPR
jgi:eukaryotic-like serine/threonine-protein kinase